MDRIRTIAKRAYRRVLVHRAQPVLWAMAAVGDEPSRLLAEALGGAFAGKLTAEEAAWVRRIEALRRQLEASRAPVEIVDYGAGLPGEAMTGDQMQSGRVLRLSVGEMCRSSKDAAGALLLFKLIRAFRPRTCLELGTALGLSAAYQAAALALNGGGTLVTLEGAPALAELSAGNLRGLGLANFEVVTGRFQDTLAGVLDQHSLIDYAFIDGHHDGAATLAYFEQITLRLAERAVLVFDDILAYASMRTAWETLAADPRVTIAVDLARMGVCVIDRTLPKQPVYRIPMV